MSQFDLLLFKYKYNYIRNKSIRMNLLTKEHIANVKLYRLVVWHCCRDGNFIVVFSFSYFFFNTCLFLHLGLQGDIKKKTMPC